MTTTNKITRAINSQYNTIARDGKINAVWYEDGKKMTDTIVVDKAGRDYEYNKVAEAYAQLIASAPEANRATLNALVEQFMADVFAEDAYMLSVCHTLAPQQLAKNLVPYYNK